MGATPSQHLSEANDAVAWPIQDDMGVVIALPSPPPLKQTPGSLLPRSPRDYLGRRVLAVQSNSPASACGLVPWLDYVIGIDGRFYVEEDAESPFTSWLQAEKRHKVHVFNIKSQSVRECTLIPTTREGNIFVGVRISALHMPDINGIDKAVHVVSILEHSPAQDAGLDADGHDYLLGSSEFGAFATLEDVEYAITSKEGSSLEVFVYNSSKDDVRAVRINPHTGWSEEGGLLGAELANGILHRVPHACRRTSGKDRFTANEVKQVAKQKVKTPDGFGELVDVMDDGSSTVKLDWGLSPNVNIIGLYESRNIEPAAAGAT